MASEKSTTEAKATIDGLPFSHPLYLHPSDTQGTSIISHILVGTENYTVWSRAMRIALLGKNKLGFVSGSCSKESQDSALHDQWERCNAVVLSWLLNSVSKELANGVIFFQSAQQVWTDLKERFDKKNGARIFALHREITSLRQGSSSISSYFSKLKELWEEQSALITLPSCTCATSTAYSDMIQEQKLLQFLMGLTDSYHQARSQILLMTPLPTMNEAYGMLLQDETQKSISDHDRAYPGEGIAMAARGRG